MNNIVKTVTAEVKSNSIITSLQCRSHAYTADEIPEFGGDDSAPDPYDYILSGLASCVAITLRQFADRKGWPLTGAEVSCTYQRLSEKTVNGKTDSIIKEVKLFGDLSEKQIRILNNAARCPVHTMLERGFEIISRN